MCERARRPCHEGEQFTEAQIVYALKQAEPGTTVAKVCRKLRISDATFYSRRTKYGGLLPSELHWVKPLATLERLVADLSLDKAMLRNVPSKSSETFSAP
ncbi:transposase family protein [Burkholderia pseudomallei]|nr:conserved domain protein [Burkholderia pseudomallei 668]AJX90708.1 transposase family protein [Burkholderia pseudomallei]